MTTLPNTFLEMYCLPLQICSVLEWSCLQSVHFSFTSFLLLYCFSPFSTFLWFHFSIFSWVLTFTALSFLSFIVCFSSLLCWDSTKSPSPYVHNGQTKSDKNLWTVHPDTFSTQVMGELRNRGFMCILAGRIWDVTFVG